MAATVQSLGIDKLPINEQLDLAYAIWDNIAQTSADSFVTGDQRQELRRRVAEDDADPDNTTSWEQIKAESPLRVES